MSALDDARTLVQDIVVPDLKALSARVDALDANMKQRFDSVDKLAEARHDLLLLRMTTGFAAMDAKFTAMFAASDAKFTAMIAASDARAAAGFAAMEARFAISDARFEALIKSLNTDRRLDLLEADKARSKPREVRQAKSA